MARAFGSGGKMRTLLIVTLVFASLTGCQPSSPKSGLNTADREGGPAGQKQKIDSRPEQTEPASLDQQVAAKLNTATVRIQVQYRNKEYVYFSGFFEKDSGLVVTSARAVGL